MRHDYAAHIMINATDETVELYHMEDVLWVEWVLLGWFVVGAAVVVWFLTIIALRQHSWLPLTLLGVTSFGLIAGGLLVQGGPGAYRDSEALWACPSGLNAMRITEANGNPLPDGIVQCRADAKKNVATGGALAGAGIALTVGSSVFLRQQAPRKRVTVDI